MSKQKFYRNDDKCKQCEDKYCCKIYLSCELGGTRNPMVWFDEWCMDFHPFPELYGVKPLFDPLIVHMTGNVHMLDDLCARGIDPHSCQYLSLNGCMIPWERRPNMCKEWKCEYLDDSDIIE